MQHPETLIIVPCGVAKVWDRNQERGPTPAKDAYTGAPFIVNRAYADRRADRWVVLSAKYGFINPDFMIPGPYNVTFKSPSAEVVTISTLQTQARQQGLYDYARIIGLGGKEYRAILTKVFHGRSLEFPFAGLPIGKAMQATKQTLSG